MKHSAIHESSGTVVSITDPATGMYMDLAYGPGETHRALHVMLNGIHRIVYVRLVKLETDSEDDLVVQLRVPASPGDLPVQIKATQPHPATVLNPSDVTRAAREAMRSDDKPRERLAPLARPLNHERTVQEALRDHPDVEPVYTENEQALFDQEQKARQDRRASLENPGIQPFEPVEAGGADESEAVDFVEPDAVPAPLPPARPVVQQQGKKGRR